MTNHLTETGNRTHLSFLLSLIFIMSGHPICVHAQSWHKQLNDTCQGINLPEAFKFIRSHNLRPRRQVVIGIIDSGVDTLSTDILPALWSNPGECLDGHDTDGNGYADDLHGWNFLGTADGSFDMISAGTEEFREFKRLYPKYKDIDTTAVSDPREYSYYLKMRKKAGIDSYLTFYEYNKIKNRAFCHLDSMLNRHAPAMADTISIGGVLALAAGSPEDTQAVETIGVDILKAGDEAKWSSIINAHRENLDLMRRRVEGIEKDTDKRLLMGDNLKDESDRNYGNTHLMAAGAEHGTFVAGIIAGQGILNPEISGIFPEARLMILRAVPEGDEYDKDVATAIHYAVDNGASVINLSLGKLTSPDADMVNRAIKYALDNDVLILQAAGNSRLNIDSIGYFPSAIDRDGKTFGNFMRVGASSRNGAKASISNYGATKVDIFAPGSDITSNTTGNKFMTASGTSIATPVAAAVAAMLRAYYPELSASDIKDILTESCRPRHKLSGLSVSGGILDASLAIRNAYEKALWSRVERNSAANLEPFISGKGFYTTWIEDTPCFHYSIRNEDGTTYYLADASSGRRVRMIKDMEKFAARYLELTGDTLDPKNPRLYGMTFEPGNSGSFFLKKKGKQMRFDIRRQQLYESRPPKEGQRMSFGDYERSHHNADSTLSMLACGYDLYLRDNVSGKVRRLTSDGREGCSHTSKFANDTTTRNAHGRWLGNRYLEMIYDNSAIKETGFIESIDNDRPTINKFKMPLPGDEGVRRFKLFWYNPDTDESRYLPIDKFPDQAVDLNYDQTAERIYFTRKSRKGDEIELCRVNVPDGSVDVIINEKCQPHINLTLFNYHLINGGKEILWWSERTGRGNYYLYDSEGNLKNRITQGDSLVAGNIAHIDTVGRRIIFTGYGNEPGVNPYYQMYYTATFDGKRQRLLTPGNYNHELQLSPDSKYAVDKYSRIDAAPCIRTVKIGDPRKSFEIDRMDISDLEEAGWKAPHRFQVKAADGITDLYGIMFLPSDFDPAKKYPIITNVYPGPQTDLITQEFSIDDNGNQSLAELGFIVINSPSRGSSPLRGRDFYTFGYGNLRDYPLADDKNTIEQLAARHPFIDLDRVGIYGHSGGGFQTVAAMLTYPDFYKVGIAASGNHDNNIYIQWWGEAFHGLEQRTDSVTGKTIFHSDIPTNMELAGNLKGRLLLITGDVDKNVPPSNTYRMADALIKAGKRFDMMILPGKDHGVQGPYYQNLIRYYFKENLLEKNDFHNDIINHRYE